MILRILLCAVTVSAWSTTPNHNQQQPQPRRPPAVQQAVGSVMLAFGLLTAAASPVHADQIGVEKEAPTLYTGETVEVRLFVAIRPGR